MIWKFISANPDLIVGFVSAAAGWFGVDRWRTKAREATALEIDRWASTAAGIVTLAIRSGLLRDNALAVEQFLEHFRKLATAAGVRVTPEHEAKALGIATKAIVAAGQLAVEAEAIKLGAVAAAALARMSKREAQS